MASASTDLLYGEEITALVDDLTAAVRSLVLEHKRSFAPSPSSSPGG